MNKFPNWYELLDLFAANNIIITTAEVMAQNGSMYVLASFGTSQRRDEAAAVLKAEFEDVYEQLVLGYSGPYLHLYQIQFPMPRANPHNLLDEIAAHIGISEENKTLQQKAAAIMTHWNWLKSDYDNLKAQMNEQPIYGRRVVLDVDSIHISSGQVVRGDQGHILDATVDGQTITIVWYNGVITDCAPNEFKYL